MTSVRLVLLLAVLLSGAPGVFGAQDRFAPIKTETPDKAVIIFERSGGFAGLHEVYKIYANGIIKKENGKRRRVDVSQVQSILRRATTLYVPAALEEDASKPCVPIVFITTSKYIRRRDTGPSAGANREQKRTTAFPGSSERSAISCCA